MKTQFTCDATAAFLESGRLVANIANAAAVAAAVDCALPGPFNSRAVLAGSLVIWALESWLAVRVAIDAGLFRVLSSGTENGESEMDHFLIHWGFIAKPRHPDLESRIQGALRLWRGAALAMAMQLALLAIGIVLHLVNV